MVETIIASALVLSSCLLAFEMVHHFTMSCGRQERLLERSAIARTTLRKVSDLLFMAGYRASVRGIHSIGEDHVSLEFLVEDGEESPGEYSRHRLYTVFRDGSKLKLTTRRRRLPLEDEPPWRKGSTTVLAEEVTEACFTGFDRNGEVTTNTDALMLVDFTLRLGLGGEPGKTGKKGDVFRTAVFLRNAGGEG